MANTICNAEVQNLIDDIKRGAKEYFNLEFNITASDLNNEEYRAMAIMFLDDIENSIADMDRDKLEYYGSTMFDFDYMINDLRNYMMALEPIEQVNAKPKVKKPAKKATKKSEDVMKTSEVLIGYTANSILKIFEFAGIEIEPSVFDDKNLKTVNGFEHAKIAIEECIEELKETEDYYEVDFLEKLLYKFFYPKQEKVQHDLVKRPAKKPAKKTTKKADRRCKAVRCITADGTVMEFASIKEAHEVTGISKTGISRCANGKQKTSGKCRWEFIK